MSEKMNHYVEQSTAFFNRHKKYAPLILFFGGFTWDSVTLTRIDRVFDNVILFLYFLLAGIFILLSSEAEIIYFPLTSDRIARMRSVCTWLTSLNEFNVFTFILSIGIISSVLKWIIISLDRILLTMTMHFLY